MVILIKILLYISNGREQAVQHIEKQEEGVKERQKVYRLNSEFTSQFRVENKREL